MTKKTEDEQDDVEDKGGEPEVKKEPESKDEESKETDEDEPEAKKAEAKATRKPKTVDLDDPAVKKALDKVRKETEKRVRDEAKAEAEQKAADAKLSADEKLRKDRTDAEQKAEAAEKRAAEAEAREALRDAMDDLEVKPAGPRARSTIIAEFAAARAKDANAEAADIIAAIQKSDGYLFATTKAPAAKPESDEEEPGTRKPTSTDARGGKTTTSHKPVEKPDPTLKIGESDPRKIRAGLADMKIRLA